MNFQSVEDLAHAADTWCRENSVTPPTSQASSSTSVRTVRYYRTLSLLDAPSRGSSPYGEKHYLQLLAVRILQAKGLPLTRIQELLIGRSLSELRRIKNQGLEELSEAKSRGISPVATTESWRTTPIDDDWLVLSRKDRTLSPHQISAIKSILNSKRSSNSTV